MPKRLENLIAKYNHAKWTVCSIIPEYYYKHGETYYANNKPVFSLFWTNFAGKPDIRFY